MKLKRLLSILVSILILMTAVPMGAVNVSAAAIDMATFNSKLAEFKKTVYAEGSTYKDKPSLYGGYECFGFANQLAVYMFGSYPTSSGSAISNVNRNWSITYGGSAVDNLVVGDIVRFNYGSYDHSIFVTAISGNTITYCQANVPAYTNKVTYSNTISRSTLKEYVSKKLNGNSAKRGWVGHYKSSVLGSPHLTIQYNANGGSIVSEIIGDTYKVIESVGLNMRKDVGTNKTIVTTLPHNAVFTVKTGETKTANGYTWGKTTYGNYTGWVVISDFVEKTGSARSSDYYLLSSLVYRSSNNKVATTVWQLGNGHPDGLYNAVTFGLTRPGYNFRGWCAKTDGSSTIFDQNDGTLKAETVYPDVKNGSATITLYAIWELSECVHIPEIVEEGYAPTCDEDGVTDLVECSICGTVLSEQEIIPAVDHEIILLEGYDATCTEDGLTEGAECALCGEILVEQEIIYAEDHQIVIIEGYDATCTEDGLSEGEVCTVCGEVLVEQEIIYAYDHDIEYLEGYEPTCTEDGLSEGEVCIVCGEVLVEQEILPATGHEAEIIYGYEPTCTEEGLTDGEECWYCGEILVEQQPIPMVSHEPYTVDGYEPTCTEEGLTDGEECYWCGEVLVEQQPIPMVPHEPYTVDGYEPTCTEEGLTDGEECYWCGEVLVEQQPIPMVSHEPYTVDGYEPTCTEEGLTDGEECWYCGEILVEQQVIPMIPHDIVIIEGYDATCTEDGITDGKECAFCGEVFVEQEDIYAYGHSYTDRYDAECNECGETREVPDRPGQPDQPPTPDLPDDAPAFVVESVTAREGEEVTVAIRTEKNSGIVSLNLMLSYDDNVLELIAVEGGDFANAVFSPLTNNPVIVNWVDAIHPNNTTNGVVALLTFRVKDGAPVGKTAITLTYDAEDVYDQNFDNVAFRVENGGVEIVEYTLGDVNGDGKINNKDLGLLQRHLADWGVEIDLPACDVNADGRVNNKDLGRLQQYLADWDVTLG